MTEIKQTRDKFLNIIAHCGVMVYSLACLWLYYHQSITVLPDTGVVAYQSDLPLHISMIVEDGWYYSFTAYAYQALYTLFGGNTFGIAFLLAVFSTLTVYATEQAIRLFGQTERNSHPSIGYSNRLTLALSLNLSMPIFMEFVGEYRYVSYQAANIWHNSTYVCMKLFALITFLYYWKLESKYREGISLKEWIIFALLNIITTGIKPSFLLAFSPIMGIFLLKDLFQKVPFKKILIFGSAMLPSAVVILWQNLVLFGEDTGNGITLNPWYTFSLHTAIPKVAVVLSAAFCGAAILVYWKDFKWDKKLLFITLMAVLGFLEALCLVESGNRSVDGNFLWGYSFCLFVLFIITATKTLFHQAKTPTQKCIRMGLFFLYGWHLYCGLEYFIRLVCGESYWMMG